jgi:hypothetical protein
MLLTKKYSSKDDKKKIKANQTSLLCAEKSDSIVNKARCNRAF